MVIFKFVILFLIILGFVKALSRILQDMTIKRVMESDTGEIKVEEAKGALMIARGIMGVIFFLLFAGVVFILKLIEFFPIV